MIDRADFDRLLELYPVLRDLPGELPKRVGAEGQRIAARAGTLLFDVGDACDWFLTLASGSVRVSRLTASGREIVLYRVAPGETCVMTVSCLLGGVPYPVRGILEVDSVGYRVPGALFLEAMDRSEALRRFVFATFTNRMTTITLLLEEIAFHKVDVRLAALLVRKGPVIDATHQMLADELGSVREVISRTLEGFAVAGLVHLDRGRIRVLDVEALQRVATLGN